MNREDIIRMAREAGVYSGANEMVFAASLERFAALVIANHPPQSYMTWQEGYEAGKQTEREALASEAEKNGNTILAMQIRARSKHD